MPKYRVLALDGGGIRGLLTTLMLERLAQQPGLGRVFDNVYLVAGNSSGALIALAMAHGLGQKSMQATLAITRQAFVKGEELFGKPLSPWLGGWWWFSKFTADGREKLLQKMLGETMTLGELPKRVLLTAFDLDNRGPENPTPDPRNWKPKIFHNFRELSGEPHEDLGIRAWKAAMYSTAAITYFPVADGFIDGGLYANNPAMCALAQLFDERYEPAHKPDDKDVVLLSLGSGDNLRFVDADSPGWGILPWIIKGHPLNLVSDGMVGIADYQCRQWLGANYERLAPSFTAGQEVSLDDLSSVEFLTQFVDSAPVAEQIERTAQWLRENWMPGLPATPTGPAVTSKHVGMATELTCLMPIRTGFVPILDTKTYATRLRILFRMLQTIRVASREVITRRMIPDIVEMARTVHAFSWSILGERQLLLTVAFDRPWEPYIRVIWKQLGPLMDVILCNCEGFVPSTHNFDSFARYVRQHQVETGFFYPASSLTIDDERYLMEFERRQRRDGAEFTEVAGTLAAVGPDEEAKRARDGDEKGARDQWLALLSAWYGLRAIYPPNTKDHKFLHRAATQLLQSSQPSRLKLPSTPEVEWYFTGGGQQPTPTTSRHVETAQNADDGETDADTAAIIAGHSGGNGNGSGNGNGKHRPTTADVENGDSDSDKREADRVLDLSNIQGGVCKPYGGVSHGCLLLAMVKDPVKARAYLARLAEEVTTEAREHEDRIAKIRRDRFNVAFTYSGLRHLGVNESELLRFPKEFSEGMEARAGLLGDVRDNHPENWAHPEWNVHYDGSPEAPTVRFTGDLLGAPGEAVTRHVRASAIDVVMTVHHRDHDHTKDWQAKVLQSKLRERCADAYANGLHIVAIEPLRRLTREPKSHPGGDDQTTATAKKDADAKRKHEGHDHFEFADGLSQPTIFTDDKSAPRDRVALGELFVGFKNDRDDLDFPAKAAVGEWARGSLIDSGAFLVIRKLSQNVPAFNESIKSASEKTGLAEEDVKGRLMGRDRYGFPVAAPGIADIHNNDFNYSGDTDGNACPFHAHIRRGNPRPEPDANGQVPHIPRLFRASLAYGPTYAEDSEAKSDRGMMFMAYNASLAEQFEVIQRWMMAGNTPGTNGGVSVFSGQPDPLLGLPDERRERMFRLRCNNDTRAIELGCKPFVTVRWGLYLFVPAIAALKQLGHEISFDLAGAEALAAIGSNVIQQLTTQDAWAAALEDVVANQSGVTQAVFAAIKLIHDGVIRTPYGVLVTNKDLAERVLHADPIFSVREYQRRFASSVGENYLGLDAGPDYLRASTEPNRILMSIDETAAFAIAHTTAADVLEQSIDGLHHHRYTSVGEATQPDSTVTLALDHFVADVLAKLANHWFDIPDERSIFAGVAPASDKDPRVLCPFHFLAPSRFVFSSPNPRETVRQMGDKLGQELQAAIANFVRDRQKNGGEYRGEIVKRLRQAINDEKTFMRELGGLVFGFVPPTFGSALQVLSAWLLDESFWQVQQRYLAAREMSDGLGKASLRRDIEHTMQEHPVPPLIHRTVVKPTKLGNVSLIPGDRVVLCMPAITDENLKNSRGDVTTVFGGDRKQWNHPTHACPGMPMAMGVIRGIMTALFEWEQELAPSPTPLTIRVRVGSRSSSGSYTPPFPQPLVGRANE